MYSYWIQILLFILFKVANSQHNEFVVVSTARPPKEAEDITDQCSRLIDKLQQKSQNVNQEPDLLPRNCQEIKNGGVNASGIYTIKPKHASGSFMVACDMETQGGGWTYLLNRYDGSQDFYRDWDEYKHGFGDFLGEFWLGLERLYQLTGFEVNELLVELTDWDNKKVFAHYNAFSVGSEGEGYSLKILGGYTGDAGDSLKYSRGCRFSTKDRDQDQDNGNCASYHNGAWWYKECMESHLTGKYEEGDVSERYKVMYWEQFRGSSYGLKKAKMMVRPRKSKDILHLTE